MDIADAYGLKKPQARFDEAVEHLGDMCLRYALRMLADHQVEAAQRYMMLAPIMNRKICENSQYDAMMKLAFETSDEILDKKVAQYGKEHSFNRNKSYDPPQGSFEIEI